MTMLIPALCALIALVVLGAFGALLVWFAFASRGDMIHDTTVERGVWSRLVRRRLLRVYVSLPEPEPAPLSYRERQDAMLAAARAARVMEHYYGSRRVETVNLPD